MKAIASQKITELLNFITTDNSKALIKHLKKLKLCAKERGILKEDNNNSSFLKINKLQRNYKQHIEHLDLRENTYRNIMRAIQQ